MARAKTASDEFLIGTEAIGEVLGRSREAARRLIEDHGLPARRLPDNTWVSSVRLIDAWIAEGNGA